MQDSVKRTQRGPVLQERQPETRIVAGNVGDHPRIGQLLSRYYQASLADDFQSRLDEPAYTPSNRLLLRQGPKLIGHLQVSRHIGWFDGVRCPLAKFADFVMLPEFRTDECEPVLLEMAESKAKKEGAILGVICTDRPEWFEQHGWSCCRGQGFSRANTRAILSHFNSQPQPVLRKQNTLEVRSWRHFELDGLRRIYQQVSTGGWGMLQRSEATWQWLVGRKVEDQILIAIDTSQEKKPDYETDPNLVGYAVMRDSCIVEMMTLPGNLAARAMLTHRVCRDAIDHDHHSVSLLTPAADPMHELLVTAGGSWITDRMQSGGTWMLKLLDPERWIERCFPLLLQRAREADLPRPLEWGIVAAGQSYRLALTRRCARFETVAQTQPDVRCEGPALQEMLLGNLRWSDSRGQQRLQIADRKVFERLAALFPSKLFWQSPFELLRL